MPARVPPSGFTAPYNFSISAPYNFSISPTCGFAFGERTGRCFHVEYTPHSALKELNR